jgi:hypothetical protein
MDSIPIIVDDVKNYINFAMTRFTFFSIECDTPSPGWHLGLEERSIPFFLLGLSGIIHRPIGDKEIFDDFTLFDELFDTVEQIPNLFVDFNEIWLPNSLFRRYDCNRSSIFRISSKLFNLAYSFLLNRISYEHFIAINEEYINQVHFSELETESFKRWHLKNIHIAQETYPKNPEMKLDYKGKWLDENRE